jgi:hypothetical protein
MIAQAAILGVALAATASIVAGWWRTGITPTPSSPRAVGAMVDALADAPAGTILDLGAGWGTLAIAAARRHPDRTVIGYELSWCPWLVACALARMSGLRNLSFRREDFLRAELPQAGAWLCYLHRRAMRGLDAQLQIPEARPGLLVSNTFALRSHVAQHVRRLDDLYRTPIYLYRWSADGR